MANPNPTAHYYGGSPLTAPGGIPGSYNRGVSPGSTPGPFSGVTGIPGGGRGSLPLVNGQQVYNYAYNVNNRDGGRASALGYEEMFFIRNDASSFGATQDPTVSWLSLSQLNAHLRSNAGRMDYGAYEDGGRLAGDWIFQGAQNTSKAEWETRHRSTDVLPLFVSGRVNLFNIWLATGTNAQKGMYLYLYACRQKIPMVAGAAVAANPEARPADSDRDLRSLLDNGGDDDAPGMHGRVPQNIRQNALRRDRNPGMDLSYAWQFYPYVGQVGECPPVDLYQYQGCNGYTINIGQVLWESPVEDHNAESYAGVARQAIFPSSSGIEYKEHMKRLPQVVIMMGVV